MVELDAVRELQEKDPEVMEMLRAVKDSSVLEEMKKGKRAVNEFTHFVVVDGVLWYLDSARWNRPKLVVPAAMQEKLMSEAHSGPFGGHFAAQSIYEKLGSV